MTTKTKRKAVKRKPRVWMRWMVDWDNGVTFMDLLSRKDAYHIAGDNGKPFRVRITEVVK